MSIIKPPAKPPEFLEPFLSYCRRRRYPNKADVVRPGDTADVLYYITEGSVVVLIEDEDGREVILDYLNKGAFIGEMGLFTPQATRSVLVLSTLTRERSRENTRAATSRILYLTPWPISTAPVDTLTLPSVYTWTRAPP